MKISRRGKDLAVRLPASLVRQLGLKPNDDVDLRFVQDEQLRAYVTKQTAGPAVPDRKES